MLPNKQCTSTPNSFLLLRQYPTQTTTWQSSVSVVRFSWKITSTKEPILSRQCYSISPFGDANNSSMSKTVSTCLEGMCYEPTELSTLTAELTVACGGNGSHMQPKFSTISKDRILLLKMKAMRRINHLINITVDSRIYLISINPHQNEQDFHKGKFKVRLRCLFHHLASNN